MMIVSALPVELQGMVAQEYLKLSDTKTSFYDKWCLAKQLDKHYDTKIFLKTINHNLENLKVQQIITHNQEQSIIPQLQVKIHLPELAPMSQCREGLYSFILTESASVISDFTRGKSSCMKTCRFLPCLGCQRNQDCTEEPFIIMTQLYHSLTMSQFSCGLPTPPVFVFRENGDIETQGDPTFDVREVIARYNLERFLE